MNGAVCLCIEINKSRIEKRIETGYLDVYTENIDEALDLVLNAKKNKEALSVGCLAMRQNYCQRFEEKYNSGYTYRSNIST
jgi:urocanate hydratase